MKISKIIWLISAVLLTVAAAPTKNNFNSYKDEKHSIDDDKQRIGRSLSIGKGENRNFISPQSLKLLQERNKRRVPEYARNRLFSTDNDLVLPSLYERERNYENNNPVESFFEELNSNDMWSNNAEDGEDKLEEGLWGNAAAQPHYEYPLRNRLENVGKRFKPSLKNYFNY